MHGSFFISLYKLMRHSLLQGFLWANVLSTANVDEGVAVPFKRCAED